MSTDKYDLVIATLGLGENWRVYSGETPEAPDFRLRPEIRDLQAEARAAMEEIGSAVRASGLYLLDAETRQRHATLAERILVARALGGTRRP